MVGGGLDSGLMICEFNKTQEKNLFGLVVRLILLYNFFFYIYDKEEVRLIAKSCHINL